MAAMALTTIAHGQHVDSISELVRANDIFIKLAIQLNNLPTNPRERIAICQAFMPQLDEAFRVWMRYGDASGETNWKIRIQGMYGSGRQALLSTMADSEKLLAQPASPATP
jgi:hypothetical protein